MTWLSPILTKARAHSRCAVVCLLLGWVLQGCESDTEVRLTKDDEVVARVNGTSITRYDVEHAGRESLGTLAVPEVNRKAYPKLLESKVQSRAIALAAEAELSDLEQAALKKQVEAYRERLLVKRYLDKHAPPKPVTPKMVADYYNSHPERFGGGSERSYELLGTTRALTAEERVGALAKLRKAGGAEDWQAKASELAELGVPVVYSRSTDSDRVLHAKLREHLAALDQDRAPEVVFVQGRAFIGRVSGQTRRPPRPLGEVRSDIERLLTPALWSSAVAQAAQQVLKSSNVEILKPAAKTSLTKLSPSKTDKNGGKQQ